MKIESERFAFEAPPRFDDHSDYTFREPQNSEDIMVDFEALPSSVKSLGALMRYRRQQLSLIEVPVLVEGETSTLIGGLRGLLVTFRIESENRRVVCRWAVALPGGGSYLQISQTAPSSDPGTDARFQHVLRSVAPIRKAPLLPPAPGFIRRFAKNLSLEVPDNLQPPRAYFFIAKGDPRTIITIDLAEPDSGIPYAHLKVPGAEVREEFNRPGAHGSLLSYRIDSKSDGIVRVRLATLALDNGVLLRIVARGPAESKTVLDRGLRVILSSISAR